MVKCGPTGMRVCSLGLVGLGFRVRAKVRVSVRDRVGVRVSDGVRVSTFYFLSHSSPQKPASPQARILPIAANKPDCSIRNYYSSSLRQNTDLHYQCVSVETAQNLLVRIIRPLSHDLSNGSTGFH